MKEFKYRGKTVEELKKMRPQEFAALIPARQRRSLKRGPSKWHQTILKRIEEGKAVIKTHRRDMVIIPAFIGLTFGVHNGKEFVNVKITEEMVGHYFGEFSLTRKRTRHGIPGIGASKSSKFVPIK